MTNPKITTKNVNGHRFYIHPNVKNLTAPSVTSIVGMLPAPYLQKWNSKVTAQCAVDEFVKLSELIDAGRHTQAVDWLKAAADRELNKAADAGTAEIPLAMRSAATTVILALRNIFPPLDMSQWYLAILAI